MTAPELLAPSASDAHAAAALRPPAPLAADLAVLLDTAHASLAAGDALGALRRLLPPLSALWTEARSIGCDDALRAQAREHPLHALLQEDPFTQRATAKPRGYAGDAVMMDFIYGAAPPPGTRAAGRALFAVTTRVASSLSVRWRRQYLRSLIDDTAMAVDGARVLSVASGHCRELDGSAVQAPWFRGDFIALDQDPLSCAEVRRAQAGHPVQVVCQGVRDLLAGGSAQALGRFDLIYSAGLYDYLPDALARRLTARLLAMLRPGGRLVVANFLPASLARGYMELFMDWVLVLRSPEAMQALAREAGAGTCTTFIDPHRNVVYAELQVEPQPA
jgi:SAM-dependent methyltransferase